MCIQCHPTCVCVCVLNCIYTTAAFEQYKHMKARQRNTPRAERETERGREGERERDGDLEGGRDGEGEEERGREMEI